MAKRKICVITGTRAEYGLLYWLMKEIESDPDLALQLVVTGTHLSAAFGKTVTFIEEDGFNVDARIDLEIGDDSPTSIVRSLGLAVIGMGQAFEKLSPDIVVVLGDRYEILAAAEAAMIARIPIAHIHGGEVTEGAMDDAMRHAITKMAHLHFVAAEDYRTRVIQLGEMPERVITVGAPGLDSIENMKLMNRSHLDENLGLPFDCAFFLVTYHPETLSSRDAGDDAQEMLAALDQFPDIRVLLTGVNADPGHSVIAQLVTSYAAKHKERVLLHQSLGQLRYLSAMKFAAAVIGNSSSGIIEAPAMGVPTVNIGRRQHGRLRSPSVIDCDGQSDDIATAIRRAMDPGFRKRLKDMSVPYGYGGASKKIKRYLKSIDLVALTHKRFHDIGFESAPL
jgi:UDP-N-acetylglucosamine 2-epimerase (non-hydrolysing)/GDP/UDP-N,N'-diacetylbacillosamine 2-epimerase (hydrolysing)